MASRALIEGESRSARASHERDLKTPPSTPLPTTARLTERLNALCRGDDPAGPAWSVLRRKANVHSSSYQTEIVTCERGDSQVNLLCKYSGDPGFDRSVRQLSHGQRGGVRYEADIYTEVLAGLDLPTPPFLGTFELDEQHRICLVTEFVDDALRVTKVPVAVGVGQAARILARFHAAHDQATTWSGLYRYDLDYFTQWPSLSRKTVERLGLDLPWWTDLADWYRTAADMLVHDQTVVHGEFYPKNILAKEGAIVVLDWETAAWGAGELDLASLIEGWSPAIAARCIDEYKRARWQGETPTAFETRLRLAQAYWYFRWLSRASGLKSALSRVESLRRTADRVGIQ